MAYHEEPISGKTDASGGAIIQLGPVNEIDDVFFLGYVTAECVDGSVANYRLVNPKTGGKLGGFAGQMAVVGPMYLKPNEFAQLVVNNGPANTQITGVLVGDVNTDYTQLQLRPVPTAAGANVGGLTTLASLTVTTAVADLQAGLQVEGAARFEGPDPFFDVTHPSYAGGAKADGVNDTSPVNAAIAAANLTGGTLLFPPVASAVYAVGVTSPLTATVYLWGPGSTIKLINNTNLPVLSFTGVGGGVLPGLTIDGNKANNTAPSFAGNPGVYINAGSRILLDGATITNTYNEGVFGSHATKCQVRNMTITSCSIAVHWLDVSNDNVIEGGTLDSNDYGIYVDYNGALATACYRNRIIGVTITNCIGTNAALAQAAAIAIVGCYRTVTVGVTIDGGTVGVIRGYMILSGDHNEASGVDVYQAGHNGFDITGNFNSFDNIRAEKCQEAGFFLSGPSAWNVAAVMKLISNGQAGGAGGTVQAGLVLNWGNPGNVADNHFSKIISTDNGAGTQLYGILEWVAGAAANYLRNRIEGGNVTGNVTAGVGPLISTSSTYRNLEGFNPQGVAAIVPGASPYTYTNNDNVDEMVHIDGGTITTVVKNGIALHAFGGAAARCAVWLEPTEALTVTYTVVPTMNKDRK